MLVCESRAGSIVAFGSRSPHCRLSLPRKSHCRLSLPRKSSSFLIQSTHFRRSERRLYADPATVRCSKTHARPFVAFRSRESPLLCSSNPHTFAEAKGDSMPIPRPCVARKFTLAPLSPLASAKVLFFPHPIHTLSQERKATLCRSHDGALLENSRSPIVAFRSCESPLLCSSNPHTFAGAKGDSMPIPRPCVARKFTLAPLSPLAPAKVLFFAHPIHTLSQERMATLRRSHDRALLRQFMPLHCRL